MKLPSLLGNSKLKEAALKMDKSPKAPILLCGPKGSGKATAAIDLAMGLFCREADGPCFSCPACLRMKAGTHADFYQLSCSEKTVKVDEIRALRANTFIKAHESDFKIFVILDCDKLSVQCQNALLKVLEEPQNCAFILTAQNREALLQTVRSRCISYHMEPLTASEIRAVLPDIGGDALALSGGYLGAAKEICQSGKKPHEEAASSFVEALSGDELLVFSACSKAGALKRDEYFDFLNLCKTLMLAKAKESGSTVYISVNDHIDSQLDLLAHNPSPTAMAGDLAAFVGKTVYQKPLR